MRPLTPRIKYLFTGRIQKNIERTKKYVLKDFTQAVILDLVVMDEAHYCKNIDSVCNNLVRTLNATAILAQTATPTPNRIKDILGHLEIA